MEWILKVKLFPYIFETNFHFFTGVDIGQQNGVNIVLAGGEGKIISLYF
jgi:hypothetical protein